MDLSQARTRFTLGFVIGLDEVKDNKDWLKQYLTANGLSSAKVIRNEQGIEEPERSRRVEFKVRPDADSRIATILDQVL
jgi:outer membrane protein OmpA-like peptidoglycan-associated protein